MGISLMIGGNWWRDQLHLVRMTEQFENSTSLAPIPNPTTVFQIESSSTSSSLTAEAILTLSP